MTTDRNRSSTGLMASDASRQARSRRAWGRPLGPRDVGSATTEKPSSYVDTIDAKFATSPSAAESSSPAASTVRSSWWSRVWKNLSGFASRPVACWSPSRNAAGDSTATRVPASFFLRWSTSTRSSRRKCSALRTLPGTASSSTSWGSTGLAPPSSSPGRLPAARSPDTRRSYSARTRPASDARSASTLRASRATQRWAWSRRRASSSTLSASMQMLSMLWPSSKTTTDSASNSRLTRPATLGSSMYW
mmetsp:Transcript_16044/g.55435  ORF Transcript_16044/g.55435 Transcript_16044/m.55435 type:complete len:248 (+) Transcript_16044:988-1731(+)